ncbi:hypothetical protein [Stappia sp. BW2]|uniref:hypothetical protein n=1 Tax=Stappia sp. BW2 TaxID=2592622 RepID=UPI0013968103|nr:hypothetical protein [Stappia sp. BW2]
MRRRSFQDQKGSTGISKRLARQIGIPQPPRVQRFGTGPLCKSGFYSRTQSVCHWVKVRVDDLYR